MALGRLGDPRTATAWSSRRHDRTASTARRCCNFVPWGAHGLSLDLMRRDRAADNGLNEFMIVALLEACPDLGVERVSLNFAVFRVGVRPRRAARRRPGARGWSKVLDLRVAVVADRVAVPVQREVPPDLAATLPVLPARRATCPGSRMAAAGGRGLLDPPRRIRRLAGRVPLGYGERQAVQSSQ